ncbi:helix-turn-helix domain-containing protein [Streptomyces sp. NPDC056534]|uniref:helix-turn-helix domain-containing protein n=1 Tax=Streptomyces sp. NPDC056534 TaxID=3345857 RepID=UPI0036B3108E
MTDTTRITVDVLDGMNVRYKDGAYFQGSKAILYTRDLTPAAKVLWLILEDHAQRDRKANPGRKRLADLMNVSPSTVDNYIAELEEQGWLIVKQVIENGENKTNDYILTIPKGLNVLADDYKRSTTELEVKPKAKLAKKPRTAIEFKERDISPRYALSYNHTREEVPSPPSAAAKALALSQRARQETNALESKGSTRKALMPAQRGNRSRTNLLEEAYELGTLEAFQAAFPTNPSKAQQYFNACQEK